MVPSFPFQSGGSSRWAWVRTAQMKTVWPPCTRYDVFKSTSCVIWYQSQERCGYFDNMVILEEKDARVRTWISVWWYGLFIVFLFTCSAASTTARRWCSCWSRTAATPTPPTPRSGPRSTPPPPAATSTSSSSSSTRAQTWYVAEFVLWKEIHVAQILSCIV